MFKVGMLVATCVSVCACAAQNQAAASGSTQQTKRVCRTVEDTSTGTLIGTRQVCEDVPVGEAPAPQR